MKFRDDLSKKSKSFKQFTYIHLKGLVTYFISGIVYYAMTYCYYCYYCYLLLDISVWSWRILLNFYSHLNLTLFRMEGKREKSSPLPTSFSPVTSIKKLQEVVPKTFWLLVLTLLSHWCKVSNSYLVPVPNYWTWTQTNSKNVVFLVKSL